MIPPLNGNLNHYCIDTVKGNHIFSLRYTHSRPNVREFLIDICIPSEIPYLDTSSAFEIDAAKTQALQYEIQGLFLVNTVVQCRYITRETIRRMPLVRRTLDFKGLRST